MPEYPGTEPASVEPASVEPAIAVPSTEPAGARPAGGDPSEPAPPEPVRTRLLEVCARVLGEMDEAVVPARLRRVRQFTPARRARSGAGPLLVALARDGAFREQVQQAWRRAHCDLVDALERGTVPAVADPRDVAVTAYLCRPPGWQQVLARAAALLNPASAPGGGDVAEGGAGDDRRQEPLVRQLENERRTAAALQQEVAALTEELARTGRSQRQLRADLGRMRAQLRQVQDEAAALAEQAAQERAHAAQELRRVAHRAEQAEADLHDARRSVREGRALADARVRLLLDTVVDAAAGLRRELAVPPVALRPADLVATGTQVAQRSNVGTTGTGELADAVPPRALGLDDPAVLDALLALPQVHLVVDGYNVTKAGFAAMPLADQRRRLVGGLVALRARTGAEVTCVFDGTDLATHVPSGSAPGVRVLFSPAGRTADEVIRRLVRAEPAGRAVVVVSSDAEVAAGVHAAGARAVPAQALLRRLGRG